MKTFSFNSVLSTAVIAGLAAFCPDHALGWSFGSWGSGSWGSFGSWGSHGSWGSYHGYPGYGSSGSYGSYYRSAGYGSHGYGSYGSYGSHGSSGQAAIYSREPNGFVPEAPPAPPEPPALPTPPQATIHMTVPADARVFVDDRATKSTGVERSFVAGGLDTGQTYAYRLRVEFKQRGKNVVKNELVSISAGDAIELDFGDAGRIADQRTATTELTLHVPKNAEVTLAGARTVQRGERRTFATSALAAGEKWRDYVVRVEVARMGETLVKEKALTLVGGKTYEMTFDFLDESSTLAARD